MEIKSMNESINQWINEWMNLAHGMPIENNLIRRYTCYSQIKGSELGVFSL